MLLAKIFQPPKCVDMCWFNLVKGPWQGHKRRGKKTSGIQFDFQKLQLLQSI